jgi:hypothetical protein
VEGEVERGGQFAPLGVMEVDMRASDANPMVYRGVSISIKVDKAAEGVYGHADLFADSEFKGRLALGSTKRRPKEVRDRLRCLAKSKVDAWAVAGSLTTH